MVGSIYELVYYFFDGYECILIKPDDCPDSYKGGRRYTSSTSTVILLSP